MGLGLESENPGPEKRRPNNNEIKPSINLSSNVKTGDVGHRTATNHRLARAEN